MAYVRIGDVVVPEIFTDYMQKLTEQKTAIITSGVVTPSELLTQKLAEGGAFFTIPSFLDLDDNEARVGTDTSLAFNQPDASLGAGTDASGNPIAGTYTAGQLGDPLSNAFARAPDPDYIKTTTEVAVRLGRNRSWAASRLAAQLAGSDPMDAIAQRISAYWARQHQTTFLRTWQGVFAANDAATDSTKGDFTLDLTKDPDTVTNNADMRVSGAAALVSDGTTQFNAEHFIDARALMGDSSDDLNKIMVHSVVYSRMQKENLIDYIPDARGETNIPTYMGMQVVRDDEMPHGNGRFETWIFGDNTTQYGQGQDPVPTEVESQAGSGNGGGGDVIYSRSVNCFHPSGFAWNQTQVPTGGPTNSQLILPANWTRALPERKQYKFVRMITRESTLAAKP